MMRRHAEGIKCGEVYWRGIANIGLPAISGIPQRKFAHEFVAEHLRDDRSAGNGINRLVAANDRRMWPNQVSEFTRATPINEGKVWRCSPSAGELRYGASHGAM
jgi:hypothetical protein